MSQIPMKYNNQLGATPGVLTINVPCVVSGDYIMPLPLPIPFAEEVEERFRCPVCFGITIITLYTDYNGKRRFRLDGKKTNKTFHVDEMRMMQMYSQMQMLTNPNEPQSMDDLINELTGKMK